MRDAACRSHGTPSLLASIKVATAALILATCFLDVSAFAGAPDLVLRSSLDDSVYAEGQRVELVVCVTNNGEDDFRDLSTLRPGAEYLGLRLRRADSGADLPMGISSGAYVLLHEGATLRPGESECRHLDLTLYFGARIRDSTVTGRLGATRLYPGRYRLDVAFMARTGFVETLTPVKLEALPVSFEVRPLSEFPTEATLVQRFLDGREWGTQHPDRQKGDYCRSWLSVFERSRFFLLLYTGCATRMSEVPFDYLMDTLLEQKAPPERISAAISIRCEIDPRVEERTPGWTDSLAKWKRGDVTDGVIDTFRRTAARERHHRESR